MSIRCSWADHSCRACSQGGEAASCCTRLITWSTCSRVAILPVSDVDRSLAFCAERLGFNLDVVRAQPRFPCRAADVSRLRVLGADRVGLTEAEPGSVKRLYLVVSALEAARFELVGRGVDVGEIRRDQAQGASRHVAGRLRAGVRSAAASRASPSSPTATATRGRCRSTPGFPSRARSPRRSASVTVDIGRERPWPPRRCLPGGSRMGFVHRHRTRAGGVTRLWRRGCAGSGAVPSYGCRRRPSSTSGPCWSCCGR